MAVLEAEAPLKKERTYTSLELEKLSFVIRRILPKDVEMNLIEDCVVEGMLLELREDIWAEKLQDLTQVVTFQTSFPSSWWQHFKERFFSGWLLKRFPIQRTNVVHDHKVSFKRYALFPRFKQSSRTEKMPYIVQEFVEER